MLIYKQLVNVGHRPAELYSIASTIVGIIQMKVMCYCVGTIDLGMARHNNTAPVLGLYHNNGDNIT